MKSLRLLSAPILMAAFAFLGTVPSALAQRTDYVTVEEEDLIRDAQDLDARVNLFLKLLDNRIVALDLRERTAKEREQAKRDLADYEREVKEAAKVEDATVRAKPLSPDVYLRKTTKAELLRGYMQIVDEIMDNIDDAYDRKIQVRDQIESLQKFLTDQLPLLRKFEPSTPAETSAIKAALSHSDQAIEDCRVALRSLPKTERPRK